MPLFHPRDSFPLTTMAYILERMIGYPNRVFRIIGHPVTWMGALITQLEQTLNQEHFSPRTKKRNGIIASLTLTTLPTVISMALPQRGITASVILSTLSAQKSLYQHVRAVHDGLLQHGLPGGRKAVSLIVGRDPETLDEPAIIRAAIESLAENFSDGVVAPLFWSSLFGLPGGVAYKAINTADSMIGHQSPRYKDFGWASARLDDYINLPASRLSVLWLILAALTLPSTSARHAWQAVQRDAHKHRSPNAGWPEAAMAGALGLRLAGPRVYGGERIDDAWMGHGRPNATLRDLNAALKLYNRACLCQALILALLSCVSIGRAKRNRASTST
ncbi:adenosylcobinamide-phosphate synthase CbiB [Neokomagataea thailandica]|uniref:Cobalamin biosynthesis protein CobD n=1 Tax=Neokomagataea tanensis NBRC 106556 TaxID=1223519 RepID=A0ABQ0QI30_9PROT|nr:MULTISPECIES: adenosylcobinamide-phosphate synthase CbiB [Neokomagataea]GBR45588.1 cobalamin biosynthesis protein CobD/CbiB [Neokomagataea tanensis NBRC 106556]